MESKNAERLVDREIYYCLSSLAEDCFNADIFNYGDIANLTIYRLSLHDKEVTCTEDGLEDYRVDYEERLSEAEDELLQAKEDLEFYQENFDTLEMEQDSMSERDPMYEDICKRRDAAEKELEEQENLVEELQKTFDKLQEDVDIINDPELEDNEIFEWWIVSDWLARKLEAKGEAILWDDRVTLWGRGCTGQAIYMDWVIQQIADECYGKDTD